MNISAIALTAILGWSGYSRQCFVVSRVSVLATRSAECPVLSQVQDDIRWAYYASCAKYGSLGGLTVLYTDGAPCRQIGLDGCAFGNLVTISIEAADTRLTLRHELGHILNPGLEEHQDVVFWYIIERGW